MAKYTVLWTKNAKNDLNEIIEYIANDSIGNAIEQFKKIKKNISTLENFPEQGRIIPELSDQNIIQYREIIVNPWRIMYKREKEVIYIMAIIDGRRNIEDILLRRQLR